MLFPTVEFALFFPAVLAVSWGLMARPRLWKPFILVASYAFYAAVSWRFCFLLGGVTIANQHAQGRGLAARGFGLKADACVLASDRRGNESPQP
jgi:D-alanyl-lipoteichoic acid acyltransferase DltB (MBOAT superfamily)